MVYELLCHDMIVFLETLIAILARNDSQSGGAWLRRRCDCGNPARRQVDTDSENIYQNSFNSKSKNVPVFDGNIKIRANHMAAIVWTKSKKNKPQVPI